MRGKKMKKRIYRCRKCRHVWNPRRLRKPKICPHCKTSFWDRSSKDLIITRKRLTLKPQKKKHRRALPKKVSH